MRVTSLGSGSSGNALLVEAGPQRRTKVLVDAGLSGRILVERMRRVGVTMGQLQGVFVTHEHSDHVLGLPFLLKQNALSLVTDPRTYSRIEESCVSGLWRKDSGSLPSLQGDGENNEAEARNGAMQSLLERLTRSFLPLPVSTSCTLGDLSVQSFAISHDAVAPCGYLLQAGGCRICVVTDTGEVTPTMLEMLGQADLLVLESNHDRQKLLRGPYPYQLKLRIQSPTGHLSNDQAADAVLQTWRYDSVRWLWLSHLSRTNNTPALALRHMNTRIQNAGADLSQMHISISPPGMGHTWDSTQLWQNTALWSLGS